MCFLSLSPQSYQMHLKSSRGPIDVLVCPEIEENPLPSPSPSTHPDHTPYNSCDESATTPHKLNLAHQHQDFSNMSSSSTAAAAAGLISADENDVSLSSIADATPDDLDCLLSGLGQLDPGSLLPTLTSFETLSPPLQEGDFNFGLDVTEGIGDLFDL